jgi:hypothetical protein
VLPCIFATVLITGNIANAGTKLDIPQRKTSRPPSHFVTTGMRIGWRTPFVTPKTLRMRPIEKGERPSPPNWIGVL